MLTDFDHGDQSPGDGGTQRLLTIEYHLQAGMLWDVGLTITAKFITNNQLKYISARRGLQLD